jgi:hypothetical protein
VIRGHRREPCGGRRGRPPRRFLYVLGRGAPFVENFTAPEHNKSGNAGRCRRHRARYEPHRPYAFGKGRVFSLARGLESARFRGSLEACGVSGQGIVKPLASLLTNDHPVNFLMRE